MTREQRGVSGPGAGPGQDAGPGQGAGPGQAVPPNGRSRRRGAVRPALAALAGLVMLAAAGCANSGRPEAGHSPQATSGGAGGTGAQGLVTPATPGKRVRWVQPVNPAQEPRVTGAASGVLGGALFGGNRLLVGEQQRLGRRLAIVRDYYLIGARFPAPLDARVMAAGGTVLASLDTVPGMPSYASIAAGRQDGPIRAFLREVNQAAVRYRLGAIYVCFQHEANGPRHALMGTPAEFARAWDHVHQLAASMHLNWNDGGRLHWVLILTSWGFRTGAAGPYWPGRGEVDIVAADGYNRVGCMQARPGSTVLAAGREAETPALLFGSVLSFAETHGRLPVFISEWGTVPYQVPGLQAAYIRLMQSFVAANREIAGAMYWNEHGHSNGCNFSLDQYPAALGALGAMGHSAALQGHVAIVG